MRGWPYGPMIMAEKENTKRKQFSVGMKVQSHNNTTRVNGFTQVSPKKPPYSQAKKKVQISVVVVCVGTGH